MRHPYETPANGDFERYVQQLVARQAALGRAAAQAKTPSPATVSAAGQPAHQPARAARAIRQTAWDEDDWGHSVQRRNNTPALAPAAAQAPDAASPAPATPYLYIDASPEPAGPPDLQELAARLKKFSPALLAAGVLLFLLGGPFLVLLLIFLAALLALPQVCQWLVQQYEQLNQQQRR